MGPHSYEFGMPGFSTHMGWEGWTDRGQWSSSLPSLQLWVSSLRRTQSQLHLARCMVVPHVLSADLHLVLLWLIYMFYLGNVSDQQLNWWKWSRNWLLLRVKCSDDKGMLLEFTDSIIDAMSPCNSENLESCLMWMTLLRSFDPTMGTCGTLIKTTNNFQHKDICQDSQWCQSPIPFK